MQPIGLRAEVKKNVKEIYFPMKCATIIHGYLSRFSQLPTLLRPSKVRNMYHDTATVVSAN